MSARRGRIGRRVRTLAANTSIVASVVLMGLFFAYIAAIQLGL